MNIEYNQLKAQFTSLTSWQDKYRELMLCGKKLPALPAELKTNETKVSGCESNVWLHKGVSADELALIFCADSDTKIVKGILVILLTMVNNLTAQEILTLDLVAEFEQLGLLSHLSESRGNGIRAIADEIKLFAQSQQ